jgi:hypothetical protein
MLGHKTNIIFKAVRSLLTKSTKFTIPLAKKSTSNFNFFKSAHHLLRQQSFGFADEPKQQVPS